MWYLTPFHFPTSFMEEENDNGIGCNIVRTEGRFNPTIFRPQPWKMKRRASSRWRGAAMVSLLGSYACSFPSHHHHLHYRSLPLPPLLRLLSSSPHNNVHRRLPPLLLLWSATSSFGRIRWKGGVFGLWVPPLSPFPSWSPVRPKRQCQVPKGSSKWLVLPALTGLMRLFVFFVLGAELFWAHHDEFSELF